MFVTLWLPLGALAGVGPFWRAGGGLEGAWALALWGEVLAGPALASWYVSRFAASSAAPARGEWRTLATVLIAAVVTSTAWLGVGWLWLTVVPQPDWPPAELFPLYAPLAFVAAVASFIGMSAVHYGLGAADRSEEALRRLYAAELTARKAELRALRAQVNPHFLFNCLHSIGALVTSDPDGARRMCSELAGFFRDGLRAGTRTTIPLGDEVALLRRYLEIERMRFGARLRASFDVASDTEAVMVPPLLLQPLVENAVRHGVATLIEGSDIRIGIRRQGERLEVEVENDFDDEGRRHGTGLGLVNVRDRLDAAYGGRARFRVEAADGRFSVLLSLPAEEAT
jgi:two-component system, LytTR family, sensor histidine kinase AlgZ